MNLFLGSKVAYLEAFLLSIDMTGALVEGVELYIDKQYNEAASGSKAIIIFWSLMCWIMPACTRSQGYSWVYVSTLTARVISRKVISCPYMLRELTRRRVIKC